MGGPVGSGGDGGGDVMLAIVVLCLSDVVRFVIMIA